MKNKLLILIAALTLLTLTTVFVSFAGTTSYETTLPTFGHKTICTGTKTNSLSYAINDIGNSDCYYTAWLDANSSGSWVLVSSDYDCYANSVKLMYYSLIPVQNTSVRLQTKSTYIFGGQTIKGSITY